MFEHLGEFARVLVTGPQRSGTRICTKMIAHDTELRFVDERAFAVDSLNRLWRLLRDETGIVVQMPALCRYAHHLAGDDDAVVFMWRQWNDIRASQERIGWEMEPLELIRYEKSYGDSATTKQVYWRDHKKSILHHFDIDYESLDGHPLWIPKERRVNFEGCQTE